MFRIIIIIIIIIDNNGKTMWGEGGGGGEEEENYQACAIVSREGIDFYRRYKCAAFRIRFSGNAGMEIERYGPHLIRDNVP